MLLSLGSLVTMLYAHTMRLAVLALALPISGSAGSATQKRQVCKNVPGDAGWPSEAKWAALNSSIDGRLLRPPPPAAVCHPDQPTYDAAACADIQKAWLTHGFHVSNPISNMWNQWNNDSCLPDAKSPCSGRGYPVYVIDASTKERVKAGVDFGDFFPPALKKLLLIICS